MFVEVGLFLLGVINNLPYVMVNSAARNIVESFGEENMIGLVFGANVLLSFVVKSINAFFLLNVPYKIRYIVTGCLMLLGLFGVAFAMEFGLAIVCIAIVGASEAFGGNVTLGYLTWFPSPMVNAWSCGTGIAGVLGSSIFVILGCAIGHHGSGKTKEIYKLTKVAFLLISPLVLVYWLAYFAVVKRPTQLSETSECIPKELSVIKEEDELYNTNSADESKPILNKPVSQADESTKRKFLRCLHRILWLGTNLCLVYTFAYVAQGCAAKVRPKRGYNAGCPELYESLQLCYQAGVFLSRSSAQIVRIRQVQLLTLVQFLNVLLWIVDVHYKFLPVACLPVLMVIVGLLGGASYVNTFYTVLHDQEFPHDDKEMCVNIAGIFIDIGIVAGAGLETILFTTILKHD